MNSTLNPYISFSGQARAAMEFYQGVFGGEVQISTFADQGVPGAPADGVMHAQLNIGGKPLLMCSDGMDEKEIKGVSLSLSGNDGDELHGYFAKLSEAGHVLQPLQKQSWGDEFGMVTDQFGVTWMCNVASA